ncbi:uncharacterized protein L969DRAFT_94905 [Mixia osmundae IAM 14324]|uniref:Uncharacterized protein n=1 Tax=Mixia osmundae (strain CBS 9802 / IAM 14324 / JCM 22182 / KY 12970) TaxID=764103 RepID=G7E1Z3_MIXOS|nr:uncharacterized protein L969DRAFT_94905 [Mixia osmundae IAM 14324]KEI38711.1 hypothetical protein L969DRAFT_94905 [Mixia osmundae IAM 14324]GAA96830.1 hypothetical protein E5Q_03503 [Mixia osmundae IAM 14324]
MLFRKLTACEATLDNTMATSISDWVTRPHPAESQATCPVQAESFKFRYYDPGQAGLLLETVKLEFGGYSLAEIAQPPRSSNLVWEAFPDSRVYSPAGYWMLLRLSLTVRPGNDDNLIDNTWTSPYAQCCNVLVIMDIMIDLVKGRYKSAGNFAMRTCRAASASTPEERAQYPGCPETYTAPVELSALCSKADATVTVRQYAI